MVESQSACYSDGHAVVIGVGGDLPVTANDARALRDLLIDPVYAAYPPDQVCLLIEGEASKERILASLDVLGREYISDDATVIVYFSGHGARLRREDESEDTFFLIPSDFEYNALETTGILGIEFTERIEAIRAKRVIVFLDCCHSAALPIPKGIPKGLRSSTPPGSFTEALSKGTGRVLIASCQEGQESYTGSKNSIFTTCLLESLQGLGSTKGDGYVRILDVIAYLMDEVPKRAPCDYDALGQEIFKQQPQISSVRRLTDNFALCYYAGGKPRVQFQRLLHNKLPNNEATEMKELTVALHLQDTRGSFAAAAERLIGRINMLKFQLGRPHVKLSLVPQGDANHLKHQLEAPGTLLVSLIHAKLRLAEFNILYAFLENATDLRSKLRAILFFVRTSASDPHQLDSEEIAAIKKLRELAEAVGAIFFDCFSEDSFAQGFWYLLNRTMEDLEKTFVPARRERKIERDAGTERLRPMYFHAAPLPRIYIPRPDIEELLLAEVASELPNSSGVVVCQGLGGTGKSTLCSRVAAKSYDVSSYLRGMFWFSFNDGGIDSVLKFFEELSQYVGDGEKLEEWTLRPNVAKTRLLEALDSAAFLVVLDGLESVQDCSPSSPLFGEISSRLLRGFLTAGLTFRRSRLLLISRVLPIDVVNAQGCFATSLGHFTEDQALGYLLAHGMRGTTELLSAVARDFGYHPLSLSILSTYIRTSHQNSISSFYKSFSVGQETPLSERLRFVLEKYWAELSATQKSLLTFLSGLDRQPTQADLNALCMVLSASAKERIGPSELNREMLVLVQLDFLQTSLLRDGHARFSIHPIIRTLIRNSLAIAGELKEAAGFWAERASLDADSHKMDSGEELEARCREVAFLLEGSFLHQAIEIFIIQRLNVRLFAAGRHDLGVPLGERFYKIAETMAIPRPARDYFSGYLPDHYACIGRIQSAADLMKRIPLDDNWTALSDQIWILLRAGEYLYARRILDRVPYSRRALDSWSQAQLLAYRGDISCLEHFKRVLDGSDHFHALYQMRLRYQYASALVDFGWIEQATTVLSPIVAISDRGQCEYPSEQIHVELVRVRIQEHQGLVEEALSAASRVLTLARAVGDDYGILCALLTCGRIVHGFNYSFECVRSVDRSLWASDESETAFRDAIKILRGSGEGHVLYGFPVEGVFYHLLVAQNAARDNNHSDTAANLELAEELATFSQSYFARRAVNTFALELRNGERCK